MAFAPVLGLLLGYIGFSLFDPWSRIPRLVHGFAFICLGVVVLSGAVNAVRAFRRGWSKTEIKWTGYLLLLPLLTIGFFAAGADWERRMVVAFRPGLFFQAPAMTLTALIEPPAYTRVAAVALPVLTADMPGEPILVPAGSTLKVRAVDTRWPPLLAWGREAVPFRADGDGGFGIAGELKADGDVRVTFAGRTIARWRVKAKPDNPPTVQLEAAPEVTQRGSLKLPLLMTDDYGVEYMALRLRRADGTGPEHVVDLPAYGSTHLKDVVYRNLTAHPLAGEEVTLTVLVVDGASQEAESLPVTTTLPRRVFTNSLALSLTAARGALLAGVPEETERAIRRLGGLSETPAFPAGVTVRLGVRTAYLRLKSASDLKTRDEVAKLLWDLALRAEDGTLSLSESELHEALETLIAVVRRGGDSDQMQAFIANFAQAFESYGRARVSETYINPHAVVGSGADMKAERDAIDWVALRRFFNRLNALAAAEARDDILNLLTAVREGLEERPDLFLSVGAYQRFVAAGHARRLLGDVMREQRRLLAVAAGPALDLAPGDAPTSGAMAQRLGQARLLSNQTALRDALQAVIGQLNRAGMPNMEAFYRARAAMDDAVRSLKAGIPEESASAQVQILTALDLAAKDLATVPSPLAVDAQGQFHDPLGRALPPEDERSGD